MYFPGIARLEEIDFTGRTTFFADSGQWHLRLSDGQFADSAAGESTVRLQPVKGRHTEQKITRTLLEDRLYELHENFSPRYLVNSRIQSTKPLTVFVALDVVDSHLGTVQVIEFTLHSDGTQLILDPRVIEFDELHAPDFGILTPDQLHAQVADDLVQLTRSIVSVVPAWEGQRIKYKNHPADAEAKPAAVFPRLPLHHDGYGEDFSGRVSLLSLDGVRTLHLSGHLHGPTGGYTFDAVMTLDELNLPVAVTSGQGVPDEKLVADRLKQLIEPLEELSGLSLTPASIYLLD